MENINVRNTLVDWIKKESGIEDITYDSRLLEENILDSMDLISLLLYVEELLGGVIPDEKLKQENFSSVNKLFDVFFINNENFS